MAIFKIYFNFMLSDRLLDYIKATYSANIISFVQKRNAYEIRVQAPSQAALDGALADIRSRLVEIQELPP